MTWQHLQKRKKEKFHPLSPKKNPINKNQGWEPIPQKYKANENTSRHNPKKKTKVNN
jgi:hypothetical protein